MFDTIYTVVINGKVEIAFDTEKAATDYISSIATPYFNKCTCLQIVPIQLWRS